MKKKKINVQKAPFPKTIELAKIGQSREKTINLQPQRKRAGNQEQNKNSSQLGYPQRHSIEVTYMSSLFHFFTTMHGKHISFFDFAHLTEKSANPAL